MRNRPNRASAFTLVEVLVVIFIIAIIVAFTIPAVLAARESARRAQCLNNMKQIALAINSHLDQKGYYPREENTYSAFLFLLPYLDQTPLFNSFNLTQPRFRTWSSSGANYTSFGVKVSVFDCPSDGMPTGDYGPASYGGNLGTGTGPYGRPTNGPFASSSIDPKIRDSMIRDGLSNTVAVSEFCRTQGYPRATRDSHAVFELRPYEPKQFDTMIQDCLAVDINQQPLSYDYRGACWGFSDLSNTSYDHNISPNGHTCAPRGGSLSGVWTASSYHPGGVNASHLDGHVSFVKDMISLPAWRAIGTMNGGEITETEP